MPIEVTTDLDYLIPELRVHIGDTDSSSYRYLDSWLRVSLVSSLKALQKWWRIRYEISLDDYTVTRYSQSIFTIESPPVIQTTDEMPLILMASVLIKSGALQDASWSTGSWRDAEVAVSNIESGRIKDISLKRDWDTLSLYLKPPIRRLNMGARTPIPGSEEY